MRRRLARLLRSRPAPQRGSGDHARWIARLPVVVAVLALMMSSGGGVQAGDRTRPNDPMFEKQWALENTGQVVNWKRGTPGADINAAKAWNLTTGTKSVVIGLIDNDLNYEAEDLIPNVWENPGVQIGSCDRGHGYHVPTGVCNPDKTGGHGTSMAWVMGAVGNNEVGTAGVNWTTAIMGVTVGNERNAPTIKKAIDWIVEARQAGVNVRVINASFNFLPNDQQVRNAIERAGDHGIFFVTGAGNTGENRDAKPKYPCNFELSNLVCVAASDQDDKLSPGSSFGAKSVHLAAPGVNTCAGPYGDCGNGTSTSVATAFVSGSAALVLAHQPNLSVGELRARILENVRPSADLEGKVASGGVLDVYCAMTNCRAKDKPKSSSTSTTTASGGSAGWGGGGSGGGGGGSGSGSTAPGSGGGDGGSSDGSEPSDATAGSAAGPSGSSGSSAASGSRDRSGGSSRTGSGAAGGGDTEVSFIPRNPNGGRPEGDAVATYDDVGGSGAATAAVLGGVAGLGGLAVWMRRRRSGTW